MKKFIIDKNINNDHWDYCIENKIPYVRINNKGTKYWGLEFDMFPLTTFERFTVVNYTDHILPLYETYAERSQLPKNKFSFMGGGRNGIMTIHKTDAAILGELLYDFLLQIHKHDQELFDANPFYVNKEGRNPEGYNVNEFMESIKYSGVKELQNLLSAIQMGNPFHKEALGWIRAEISARVN